MFKDELIIIRHARSENNIRRSDELDCKITAWGVQQASTVGRFLSKHMNLKGFVFHTSPFLRCLQTSDLLHQQIGEPFHVNQYFREYINHCGREVTIPKRDAEFPFPSFLWADYPQQGVTYKDEFNEELLHRVHEGFERLPSKSLVVTHGLPALQLLHVAINPAMQHIPIWDHSIDNCSITYIVKGRLVWHGRSLYTELGDEDPFEHRRAYDKSDMLK